MTDVAADESVEEEIEGDGEEGADQTEGQAGSRFSMPMGKLRSALIGVVAVLLLAGAGAGVYFSGLLDGFIGGEEEIAVYQPVNVVFYDLPEMIVNLVSNSKKPAYLKIQMSLELDENEDLVTLERLMPRVIDHFQVFLRELRVDDLNGSAGIYRIKEELLRRVSVAVYPVEIRDVLFKEMLIQ
jgi:flagellar FliL protein